MVIFVKLARFAALAALALRDISRRRFFDNAAARAFPPLLRNSASVRIICRHYTMHASTGSAGYTRMGKTRMGVRAPLDRDRRAKLDEWVEKQMGRMYFL